MLVCGVGNPRKERLPRPSATTRGYSNQTAKEEGDKIRKKFLRNIWEKRYERQNVGGVYTRSRNGAPSR